MYRSLSLYISISISISLSLYVYVCMYIYIYIYIHIGGRRILSPFSGRHRGDPWPCALSTFIGMSYLPYSALSAYSVK